MQADLGDLPFSPGRFDTMACFGVLHVLDEPWVVLAALGEQLAPGGAFIASMLVADRAVGRAHLRGLHRVRLRAAQRSLGLRVCCLEFGNLGLVVACRYDRSMKQGSCGVGLIENSQLCPASKP